MEERTVLIICDGREFVIKTTLDTKEIVGLISTCDGFITLEEGIHIRADKVTAVQEISKVSTNNNCNCDNSKSACGTVVKTNKDEIVTVMLDGEKLAKAVVNAINNITVKSNLKI